MTRRTVRLPLVAAVAAGLSFVSTPSRADATKDQCVDANTRGQDLRRAGKLSAARDQLRQCASPSCPGMVRDDCTKRLDELENAQPAIVFDAKDASGRDVSLVQVTLDGHPITERLDGTALQVDPGEHVFVFTAPGQAPVTQAFVLKEGDKERRERILIGAGATAPLSGESMAISTSPQTAPGSRGGMGPQKILGLVAGGMGVAGLAAGGVFTALSISEGNQQQKDCPTSSCGVHDHALATSEHSTGETEQTVSIVGFAAGGALLVGGAILFFTGHSTESARTGMLLVPSVGPGGGGMFLRGEF